MTQTHKNDQKNDPQEWPISLTNEFDHENDLRAWPMTMTDEFNLRKLSTRITHETHVPHAICDNFHLSLLPSCGIYHFTLFWVQVFPKRLTGILSVFLAPFRCITQEVQRKKTKNIPFFAYLIIRSSRTVAFCKEGVLTKLTKFTRKYCCWILTFNEVANLQHATLSKRNSTTGDFMGTLWNFSDDVTYIFQLSTFTT